MTISRLFASSVWTAFVAATVAILSLHPAPAQQRPSPPPNPLPITPAHPNPAPGAGPLPPSSNFHPSSPNSYSWTALGPASLNNNGFNAVSADQTSGRITGVAVDPTNANTIYVAAAGGGVWKTTDGGSTWASLTDRQQTLAMGSIAVAPSNRNRIYAGTGEANNCGDCQYGEGILVSSNGGSTWSLATAGGAFAGVAIGQIAVDPTNANTAYAAVGGLPFNGTLYANEGIWKTTDGGNTWTNVTAAASLPSNVPWSSVVVDPNTHTTIYAAIGGFGGGGNNGVYRSTDSGSTWSLLANAPNGSDSKLGRIALAVSPAANIAGKHVLYVASNNTSNYGLGYFLRSNNADAASPGFTDLTSSTPDFLGGENNPGQGWYDIAVNVDKNGNVYCAGVVNYKANPGTQAIITSTDTILAESSPTWTDLTVINNFEPHSDNHAIAFDSSNNMLVGGDGGIFRYNPASPGWTDLNGDLNTIQFEGIGLNPTSIDTVVGGSQDNGTELYSGNPIWNQVRSGDGGPARFSQTDGSVCYHEYSGISLERSSDGCNTWTGTGGVYYINPNFPASASNFYPPYTLDPTNGDHLLYGTDLVNESTNGGTSWNYISDPGTNGFNSNDDDVDSVAISPANGSNPQVIYAATGGAFATGSQIFVTSNDGSTWTSASLPACAQNGSAGLGCRVNQVLPDPNDPTGHTAIAVTSNFSGSPSSHVFRTTNEGSTWTNITGNLPDLPTWSVVVDTDPAKTMYISNDTAVYSSPSPYGAWTLVGTFLPNAEALDLQLNSSLRVLGVATHGRGAWEIAPPAHVSGVTSTAANGNYYAGNIIPITITFNTAVTVSDTPTLTLNTSPAAIATYASGSGTDTLTFNYTVISGQSTSGNPTGGHLDYASGGALSLNGGTIVDADGTAAELTLYAPGAAGSLSANSSIVVVGPAALTSPASGSVLTGPKVTFTWNAVSGATGYGFRLGTAKGANDVYASGLITATSATDSALPTNGEKLYARLYTYFGSATAYADYVFTAATAAALTSPQPSTTLAGPTIAFTWSAGTGASGYALRLGTTLGGNNLYASGVITATSRTVSLPTNGETIYARLYTYFGSANVYTDYVLTAATAAALTAPTPGTTLAGAKVTFTWSAGTEATGYALRLGTTLGGNDLYGSGITTATSKTVPNLPTNGETIYARVYTYFGSSQVYTDYTYTAAP